MMVLSKLDDKMASQLKMWQIVTLVCIVKTQDSRRVDTSFSPYNQKPTWRLSNMKCEGNKYDTTILFGFESFSLHP